jgi:hypothetical protein
MDGSWRCIFGWQKLLQSHLNGGSIFFEKVGNGHDFVTAMGSESDTVNHRPKRRVSYFRHPDQKAGRQSFHPLF